MSGHLFEDKFDMSGLITILSVKSGEYADIIRIKAELFSIKKQRDEMLLSLGKTVYKMARKGSFDQQKVSEKCLKVAEAEKLISIKEAEIDHVHDNAQKILKRKGDKKSKHKHEKQFDENIVETEGYEIEPLD